MAQTIYYTLQSSCAVLGVYCNKCDQKCSFGYSHRHNIIALWTLNKESILCPDCAKDWPDLIYRQVFYDRDIPIDRSTFKSESMTDRYMFSNDSENKKSYGYRFCTIEDEIAELQSKIPRQDECDCKPNDLNCPYSPYQKLVLMAPEYASIKFPIDSKSYPEKTPIDIDWYNLISKLFLYTHINEFDNEQIIVNDIPFIITKSQIMIGMNASPWRNDTLNNLKVRMMLEIEKLSFETITKCCFDKFGILTNLRIYITPRPFKSFTDSERDLDILFEIISTDEHNKNRAKQMESYPAAIDGMINNKKINRIEAFQCMCVSDTTIKSHQCSHSIHIYFADGNYSFGNLNFSVEELVERGYTKYIKQYRPRSNFDLEKQIKNCKLTQLIGLDNLRIYK